MAGRRLERERSGERIDKKETGMTSQSGSAQANAALIFESVEALTPATRRDCSRSWRRTS